MLWYMFYNLAGELLTFRLAVRGGLRCFSFSIRAPELDERNGPLLCFPTTAILEVVSAIQAASKITLVGTLLLKYNRMMIIRDEKGVRVDYTTHQYATSDSRLSPLTTAYIEVKGHINVRLRQRRHLQRMHGQIGFIHF